MTTDFFAVEKAANTTWTPEQRAIFDAVKSLPRGGALAVLARAGAGKTTTAVESLQYARRAGESNKAMFLAFNKRNGDELHQKTPANVVGATFHSVVMRASPMQLEIGKIWRLAKEIIPSRHYKLRAPAVQLASLAKNLAVGILAPDTLDIWKTLILEYGIRHQKRYDLKRVGLVAQELFHASLQDSTQADFDDYLYVCARDGFGDSFKPLDWLYIDEFQDTNPTQMLVIDRIREASGGSTRLVLIGDPKQAIYGWRGAGVQSFEMGVSRYRAEVLPLTTSWRCPREVIASAQELVPDIRAREDAADGSVETVPGADFDLSQVDDGDVVLCRNNAPLFELALQAIEANRKVNVAGKGLDKKVIRLFERLFRREDPSDGRTIFAQEIVRINDEYRDRPMAKSLLLDEVEAARAVWEIVRSSGASYNDGWATPAAFYEDASRCLSEIFFDPAKDQNLEGLTFSTIHMAKGLEWDTVWFYRPELIPSRAAITLGGWHLEQEDNLDYVARTRAKRDLRFVVRGED